MGAGRYQLVISTLLTLCSAAGLLGIGRNIVVGMDALAWLSFALMFALAWYARWMIHRMPLLDEAIIRVQDAPAWSDLSPARRRFLWWFDWPLFTEIRNGEVRRLFSEPLVSVQFVSGSAILQPLEEQHCEQYFLNKIAGAVSIHGLTVSNVKQGYSAPGWTIPAWNCNAEGVPPESGTTFSRRLPETGCNPSVISSIQWSPGTLVRSLTPNGLTTICGVADIAGDCFCGQ